MSDMTPAQYLETLDDCLETVDGLLQRSCKGYRSELQELRAELRAEIDEICSMADVDLRPLRSEEAAAVNPPHHRPSLLPASRQDRWGMDVDDLR